MQLHRLAAYVAVTLTLAACESARVPSAKVEFDQYGTIEAKVPKDNLPPIKRVIATESEWRRFRAQINPHMSWPEVDFTTHFLMTSTQDGADPNRQSAGGHKGEDGVVRFQQVSTLLFFKPGGWMIVRFHRISREGVIGIARYDPKTNKEVIDPLPR